MPHYNLTDAPARLDLPSFVLNYDLQHGQAQGLQLQCWARTITPNVDDEELDIETFCNPQGTQPGATSRDFDISLFMTVELWNYMIPLQKKLVTFALLRDSASPVSPTNPEISGQVWVPSVPDPIQGDVGSVEPITLKFREYQTTTRVTATTVVAAATTHPL